VTIPASCRERFLPLDKREMHQLVDSGVTFAGISTLYSGYAIHRDQPIWHTLIYTVAGEASLLNAGKSFRLTRNTIWIGPAGLEHHYQIAKSPWRIAWLCLAPKNRLHFSPEDPRIIHANSPAELEHAMRQLIIESDSEKPEQAAMIESYSRLIYLTMKRDIMASHQPPLDSRHLAFEQLVRDVRGNPGAEWSAAELRQATGLSVSNDRFRQLCRAYLGKNPIDLVATIRMETARELLCATDYLVYSIAGMVGYKNEYAFSAAFHRETGASPTQYRLECRKKPRNR
jgi:AraC-like DNA-binding protein